MRLKLIRELGGKVAAYTSSSRQEQSKLYATND
jgi:hypothetical protein